MTFNKLPPELVLMISRHLSTVDVTCMALCNHYFMSCSSKLDTLLGKRWPGIRTGRSDDDLQIDLLTRLSRNLPRYYLCFACLRLHLWQYVKLPSPKFNLRSCFDAIQDRTSSLLMGAQIAPDPTWLLYKFHFVHLHLAMRRYYFGPSFGISTESLMYTEVNIDELLYPPTPNFASRTGMLSIDARVCTDPPGLGLRIQRLAVLKRHDVQNIFIGKDTVRVCTHLANYPSEFPDYIKSSLKNRYSDFSETIKSLIQTYCQQDGTPDSDSHFYRQGRCYKCNTSWKLELREIETQDVCLLLTRWKDLGPGLDPEDDRWRNEQEWAQPKTLKFSEMVGDPRLRFERPSDCSSPQPLLQEEMFQRNLSLLRGKRYEKVMTKSWGPWYYLHGKERQVNHSRCIIS